MKDTAPHFVAIEHGQWRGVIEGFGLCDFSVTGTYGDNRDPRVIINRSEFATNCQWVAIDWATGKTLKVNGPISHYLCECSSCGGETITVPDTSCHNGYCKGKYQPSDVGEY